MSQLQLVLQKVLDAVIVMRCDGTIADWNKCAEATFGWTRHDALDRSLNELIVPAQHRTAHARGLEHYLATGEGPVLDRRVEIEAIDSSGREFPVELTITEASYRGERVFIGFLRDISERKRAEAALRQSEARLSATYNHAFVGIAEADAKGGFLRTNEQFCRITGYTSQELLEQSITTITHPDDVLTDWENYQRQWSGELDNYSLEKRYIHKDGKVVWVEVDASIVREEPGLPAYAVRIVRDITDRKTAERHQHLLLSELRHRVKNSLTVVQALAVQSFKGDAGTPEQLATFQRRLSALAEAHEVLVQENWTATPVQRVIEGALRPFDLKRRFDLKGPELLLPPQIAVTFSLALHELATNAAKYGALSNGHGRIHLTWSSLDNQLELRWVEIGGPAVAPPHRTGFGTRLMKQGLARELRGRVDLEYAVGGLVCTIVAPVPELTT